MDHQHQLNTVILFPNLTIILAHYHLFTYILTNPAHNTWHQGVTLYIDMYNVDIKREPQNMFNELNNEALYT